jgi:CRISPR-associated Csx2 family protein
MRNVFISFLGTGNYTECDYVFKEKYMKTKYIQLALISFFCNDFTKEDRILFFLTEDAKAKSWENGLKEKIQSLNLVAEVKTINIPVGKSEDEIWEIFNTMHEALYDNDSVIFDITHAFRSIPMLGFITLYYANFIKNVTIKDIYYGAFEARDIDTNRTPIFQLTQFYNLIQWSSAADAFVNYGINDKLNSIVKETSHLYHGTDGIASAISTVTESMSTLRGSDIVKGSIFSFCKNKIDKLQANGTFQTAFKPIMQKVKEKLSLFNENDSMNFLYAVKWYLDHKMIPQALTMMQEGLLTFIMEMKKIDYHERKNRDCVSYYLNFISNTQGQNKSFHLDNDKEQKCKTWGLTPDDAFFINAAGIYSDVRNLRNDVNHGGFNKGATPYQNIILKANKHFETLEKLCQMFSAS